MQLTDYKNSSLKDSSPFQSSAAFSFEDSPVAFMLLSDGLYKDGVRAAIREIACNARDAHTLVGKDEVPIEVKLPNAVDPVFYVRDFGPGLSVEMLEQVYNVYFKSTKAHDDRQTGGFGLGAKSPFAYTDNFMVISRHRGERYTYSAFKDDEGFPRFARLATEPCDPNDTGITVSFPVRPEDFDRFQTIAIEVLREFDVLPNLLGATKEFSAPDVKCRVGPTLAVRDSGNLGHGLYLRMANVVYPVLLEKLELDFTQEERAYLQTLQDSRTVVVDVPAGSFVPLPSREDVKYYGNLYRTIREVVIDRPLAEVRRLYRETVEARGAVDYATLGRMHTLLNAGLNVKPAINLRSRGQYTTVSLEQWIADKLEIPVALAKRAISGTFSMCGLPGGVLVDFRDGIDVRIDLLTRDSSLNRQVRRRALQDGMHHTTKPNTVAVSLDSQLVLVANATTDSGVAGRIGASLAARKWAKHALVITRGKRMTDEQFDRRVDQIRKFMMHPPEMAVDDERIGLAEFSLAVEDEDEAAGLQSGKKERTARRTLDQRRAATPVPVLDLAKGELVPNRSVGDMLGIQAGQVLWHPRVATRGTWVDIVPVGGCSDASHFVRIEKELVSLERMLKLNAGFEARYVAFPLRSEIESLALEDVVEANSLDSAMGARIEAAAAHRNTVRACAAMMYLTQSTRKISHYCELTSAIYSLLLRSKTAKQAMELFEFATSAEQKKAREVIEAIFDVRGRFTRAEIEKLAAFEVSLFAYVGNQQEAVADWVRGALGYSHAAPQTGALIQYVAGALFEPQWEAQARAFVALCRADPLDVLIAMRKYPQMALPLAA